jgi:hypothetical protein
LDKGQKIEFNGDFAQEKQSLMIFEFEKCQDEYLQKMPGYNNKSRCMNYTEAKPILQNMGCDVIYTTQ